MREKRKRPGYQEQEAASRRQKRKAPAAREKENSAKRARRLQNIEVAQEHEKTRKERSKEKQQRYEEWIVHIHQQDETGSEEMMNVAPKSHQKGSTQISKED